MGLYWVSWLYPVVGLGRSVALRSPKGGGLRAERRPRPPTTRGWAGPARVFDLGNLAARDGRAPVSSFWSSPEEGLSLSFPSPASRPRDARQSLSISASAPGNEFPGCHLPLRTPSPCPSPARAAGFGVPLDRSGSHAVPPSRYSAPVPFPAGRSSPTFSPPDSAGDRPPAPPPSARIEHCVAGSTLPPNSDWRRRTYGSSSAAASSPNGPDASRDFSPPALSPGVNSPPRSRSLTSGTSAQTASPAPRPASARPRWARARKHSSNPCTTPGAPRSTPSRPSAPPPPPRSSPPSPAGTASSPSHRPPCSSGSPPAPALPARRESSRPVAPTPQSAPSSPAFADALPSAAPGSTTLPLTSNPAAFLPPVQSRLPPPNALPPASDQTAPPLLPRISSAADSAPAAVNSSPSLGSIPVPRSHALTPWFLSPGNASTTSSPADNSPSSAPLLALISNPLPQPAKVLPLASVPAHSSLSSSIRPPLEAFSLGDTSIRARWGHYHPGTTTEVLPKHVQSWQIRATCVVSFRCQPKRNTLRAWFRCLARRAPEKIFRKLHPVWRQRPSAARRLSVCRSSSVRSISASARMWRSSTLPS